MQTSNQFYVKVLTKKKQNTGSIYQDQQPPSRPHPHSSDPEGYRKFKSYL